MLIDFLLCYAGWTAMALSLDRHHDDALGIDVPPGHAGVLRYLGWGLLTLSLLWAGRPGAGHGPTSIAIAVWCVALTLAALAVTACMTWRPRRAVPLGVLALAAALPVGALA